MEENEKTTQENQEDKTPTPPETTTVEEQEDTKPDEEEGKKEDVEEGKEENPPEKDENEIKDTLNQNGLDYQALEEEYFANGGLTEETRTKLNKMGFTNDFIDDFIKGKEALAELEKNELAEVVGGRENFDNVIQWASKNLSAEEINSINGVRDKNVLKFLLPSLKAAMDKKEGKLPQTIMQGNNATAAQDIFESREQMYAAIRDERYGKDPAYVAKVTQKIRASREAGIDLGI